MARLTLLCAALWAACAHARMYNIRDFNSSSTSSSSSSPSPLSSSTPVRTSSTSSLSSTSPGSPTGRTSTITSSTIASNSSTIAASTNASTTLLCTGCVLEAYRPSSTWFSEEWYSKWTSVVVTETVTIKTISYFTGTPEALETVITVTETVNQTKTLVGPSNQTISHSTPVFTVTPTAGVEIELPAGPTYVIYRSLYGGLDFAPTTTPDAIPSPGIPTPAPEPTCEADVDRLRELLPTRSEDWAYFIHTELPPSSVGPLPLPQKLVDFLKQNDEVKSIFSGSDIATCTLRPTEYGPSKTQSAVGTTEGFSTTLAEHPPPPGMTQGPSTYLSVSYESTSTHVTVRGCLRCNTETAPPVAIPPPGPTTDSPGFTDDHQPDPIPTDAPKRLPEDPNNPNPSVPSDQNNKQPEPSPPAPERRISIGDNVYIVHPAQSSYDANNPPQPTQANDQNNPVTGVVIGTHTLTPGEATLINGYPVLVPTSGYGSSILVGGSTVAVYPATTGPAVLTMGDSKVTANSQGQFLVGSQTLTPGGPAITVDGTTLSVGPSGSIAILNGVTQTLGNAPLVTNAPALTVNGQIYSATVLGGTTAFVLGEGQTLTPGGVITSAGTTYSMPSDGSGTKVVVNGVTSTFNSPGLPVLTLNSQSSITATVRDGTSAFVLGPGQTLTPGGAITVSGTTYSLPASASGSVVVINGVTSTLPQNRITSAPAVTIDGKTISATVRDGTTEFVIAPGTTLKPGEQITISGKTYSLDPKGTALVVDGKTSTIAKTPASNSATTTPSASKISSSSSSSLSSSSSSTSSRNAGNFIASGLSISSTGGAMLARGGSIDTWAEGIVVGLAGWLLMLV